jgi:hypothetical protein
VRNFAFCGSWFEGYEVVTDTDQRLGLADIAQSFFTQALVSFVPPTDFEIKADELARRLVRIDEYRKIARIGLTEETVGSGDVADFETVRTANS